MSSSNNDDSSSWSLTASIFGAPPAAGASSSNNATGGNAAAVAGLFDPASAQRLDAAIVHHHRRTTAQQQQPQRQSTNNTTKRKRQRNHASQHGDNCPKVTEILETRRAQASHPVVKELLTLKCNNQTNGEPEAALAEDISSTLKTHGVVVVRNVFAKPQLDPLVREAQSWRTRICRALRERNLSWNNNNNESEDADDPTTNNNKNDDSAIRFWEVALRCPGRMDVRYVNGSNHDQHVDGTTGNNANNIHNQHNNKNSTTKTPIWQDSSLLQSVVQNVLDPGVTGAGIPEHQPRLVYAGWIFSFPGSHDQPWHQDGMPLFPTTATGRAGNCLVQQLPPYAINVFVPLQDEDAAVEAGPTEFVVGSHRLDEATALRAVERRRSSSNNNNNNSHDVEDDSDDDDDDSPVVVGPVLRRGDALMYDYRTCHRGTANLTRAAAESSSTTQRKSGNKKKKRKDDDDDDDGNSNGRVRTVLYLMYARPWFREHLNFGSEKLLPD